MTILGGDGIWLLPVLAVGIIQLFYGYRALKLVIVVLGAIIGYTLGPELAALIYGAAATEAATFIAALLTAAIFAALAWFAFGVALFIWGASAGLALAAGIGVINEVAQLAVAAITGLFVAWLRRPLIIVLTSLHGGFLTVTAVAAGAGYIPMPTTPYYTVPVAALDPILAGATVVLAVIGATFQFRRN